MIFRRLSMTNRKIHIFLLFFVIIALSISVPKVSLSRVEIQETGSNLIAGRNVNMVSGTVLPGGDPWLQRQNEPSIAVSTRNPLHLLAGANDYRTVDVPFSQGSLPGLPEGTAAAGDAWLGVFKSFDGGQSWQTTLLPGYPQDVSDEGASSPLMGLQAAADPTVRAGASGLFFYSGIAFNRVENGTSVIFVSRYMDNNNTETGDSIDYIDTTIIDVGNSGQFGDKPWIAVDKPRDGQTAFINGQDVPVGDIYIVYSIFLGDLTLNIHNKIMFVKSSDYGNTWSNPQKLSESQRINQGTTIAVAPDGTIYVAWRRFASPDETDAIMFSRSTDGGKKFSKAFEVATIVPFDQPSINAFTLPGAAFRTNSFPTLTVGKDGDVFIAWAQRNMDGRAQIVLTSRTAKLNKWDLPATPIDPITQGHQFMPTLTYAAGKLTAAWYDSRNDFVAPCTPEMIADDPNCQFRHTIDVMAAQLDQYAIDPSWAMTQVSRYIYYLVENPTDPSGTGYSVSQMQFNPPNFPLFQGGTQPFMGDYIDISPSPKFITDDYGNWQFNTDPTGPSTFHIAWTDNRDVNPPPDTDWTLYNPPLGKDGQPNSPTPCSDGDRTGMRNQNIYTSQLTSSVRIGSPGNFKSTGEFGRAFVIIVENVSAADKYFLLEITDDDEGSTIVIDASFLPTSDLELLAVGIAPYSSISRSVFVEPNPDNPTAPIKVDVYEINPPTDPPGEPVVISGILGTLVLNLDPNNPDTGMWEETHNPNISSPTVFNWDIGDMGDPNVANPNILNPNILNPNILNPNILNPNILNPNILNPNILNPNILNPNILNPNILNPNILNPNILNPNILNPNILNPNILNPNILNTAVGDTDFSDASVTDVFWTVKNEGNTTSSYTFKTIAGEDIPIHFYSSLSIYRINFTAAAQGCDLGDVPQQDLILRVANPNILNPNILNPNILNPSIEDSAITNATFSLAPGEVAVAVLQVIDPGAVTSEASTESAGIMENGDEEPFDPNSFANSLATYVTAQSPNSDGEYAPIALQILTVKLPDGEYGVLYDQELFTIGGTGQYTWNIETIQGENPHPDLELVRIPGTTETPDEVYLRGTPFIGGEYTFTVKVTDESVPQQEDYQTYTLNVQSYFNLAATVEPAGSGSVSPAVGTYAEGTEVELIATPNTIDGYKFVNWTGNGVPEGQENTNPLIIIMNGGTDITANFELEEYTITASSGANGSISPLGEVIVEHGLSQTFTFEPALNYHLDEVLVDGAPVTLDEGILSYTFTNVTGIHTISVTYAIDQYAIAASSGANGAISPSGQVMVEHGSSQIFTMIPAEFHHVDAVQVDGAPVTLDENLSYTFTNV